MPTTELLRAPEAARRLGIPTKELLRLVYERRIRYVMVRGIAYVPEHAIEEFRGKGSCGSCIGPPDSLMTFLRTTGKLLRLLDRAAPALSRQM